MANETPDEFHSRNRFFYVLFILMPVVMESDHFSIIFINSGCSYNRATEIAPDIFDYSFRVTFIGFVTMQNCFAEIAIDFSFQER